MKKVNDDDRSRGLNKKVVKVQEGDPIATEELCRLFAPLVQSQARSPMVRNLFGEDALGIVWLAFLEVLRKKQLTMGDIAGYVAVALKYEVLKKAKLEMERRSKVRCEEEALLMKAEAEAEGLEALWEREEFLLEVRRLRPLFTKKELQVLEALFKEDRTIRQLAEELGVKENAVRQTYDRALKKLRRLLKEDRV